MSVNPVNIVVIGDSRCGKTSLIAAAATETFPEAPPPVLPPAKLPADTTPEMVPVVITDTSSRVEDQEVLHAACRQASVIVLCFRMDEDGSGNRGGDAGNTGNAGSASLRRVSSFWMPELKRLHVKVPVLLVGCKSDLRPADESLHKAVLPVIKAYPQIETCMECSAKKLQFVGEVFYYALKTVLYPMAPLYDPEMQSLKPLCVRALKRIFLMCDKDKDGLLNDKELNEFQVKCFNAPLQPEELAGVKDVVKSRLENGLVDNHLTFTGFVFLHALFIERGRLETTWAVLTTFGYGKELDLSIVTNKSDAVHPKSGLSQRANAYFGEIFDAFDADGDGVLSPKEQDQLFGSFPDAQFMSIIAPGMVFEKTKAGITRGGFLSFWNYAAIIDPRAVVEGALYSGFDASEQAIIDAFFDGQGQDDVKTVQCTLFCHNDSCRDSQTISSLLANLVNLPATDIAGHGGACGALTPEEIQGAHLQTDLPSPIYLALDFSVEKRETMPHVGAFVFDWATCTCDQFSALMDAMVSVASSSNDALPCLLIGLSEKSKDDQLLKHVEAACEALHIPPPISVAETASKRAVYAMMVKAALEPDNFIPETPTLVATKQHRRFVARATMFVGISCVLGAGCFVAYRSYRTNRSASSHR